MKIAVHVHIFHLQLWAEVKESLKNIEPYEYDLFVTMVEENLQIQKDILLFKSDTKIYIVENRGFDVWPFVYFLNNIDLGKYDFVIKLHTKKDSKGSSLLNNAKMKGSMWREYLLSILKSKEVFKNNILAFENDEKLGMIADFRLIIKKDTHDKKANKIAKEFMQDNNLVVIENSSFVAGTMFITRALLMQPIKDLRLSSSYFQDSSSKISGETFAHSIERVFGYAVYSQGYYMDDPMHGKSLKMAYFVFGIINRIKRFLFQSKVTKNGNLIIKICKIPIFYRTLNKNK